MKMAFRRRLFVWIWFDSIKLILSCLSFFLSCFVLFLSLVCFVLLCCVVFFESATTARAVLPRDRRSSPIVHTVFGVVLFHVDSKQRRKRCDCKSTAYYHSWIIQMA